MRAGDSARERAARERERERDRPVGRKQKRLQLLLPGKELGTDAAQVLQPFQTCLLHFRNGVCNAPPLRDPACLGARVQACACRMVTRACPAGACAKTRLVRCAIKFSGNLNLAPPKPSLHRQSASRQAAPALWLGLSSRFWSNTPLNHLVKRQHAASRQGNSLQESSASTNQRFRAALRLQAALTYGEQSWDIFIFCVSLSQTVG